MPRLNGSTVRHRVAELDLTLREVSQRVGVAQGTLRNATRKNNPQPVEMRRVYRLRDVLGLSLDELVDLSMRGDPATPPPKQPKGPSHPPKRQDHEGDKKRPPRTEAVA